MEVAPDIPYTFSRFPFNSDFSSIYFLNIYVPSLYIYIHSWCHNKHQFIYISSHARHQKNGSEGKSIELTNVNK
jgi:hypothetical protein